jgi:hypothetical protein
MTRAEVLKMLRRAGFIGKEEDLPMWVYERFAEIVAKAERKACAKVALKGTGEAIQTKTLKILQSERERIANAILARGET